jgi:hypothetical protein
LLGKLSGRSHVKRLCEATGVSNDMDELCQDLWGNRDEVAHRQQPGKRVPCTSELGMLHHLRCDKKAGVEAMDHARPSSISRAGRHRKSAGEAQHQH